MEEEKAAAPEFTPMTLQDEYTFRDKLALDRLDRLAVMLEGLLKVQTVAVSIAATAGGHDADDVAGMIEEVEAAFAKAQAKPEGAS